MNAKRKAGWIAGLIVGTACALGWPATAGEVAVGPVRIVNSDSESVCLGRDLQVAEGESLREAVVIAGDALIEGEIERDLFVLLGNVRLGPSARIGSELIVIGGTVERAPTATVGREEHIVGLEGEMGAKLVNCSKQWFVSGLLLGRPLPHDAGWAWIIAGAFLAVYFLLALFIPRPIEVCLDAARTRPLSSFLIGLLSFLLIGPLLMLLTISVVGLVVIPFLGSALVLGFLMGKVVVCQYAGMQLGQQLGGGLLKTPLVALFTGALLFGVAYAIPVIGFLAWSLSGTLGFGAVVLSLFRSVGSEPPQPVTVPSSAIRGESPRQAEAGAEPPQFESIELQRAGFWIRAVATLIDFVLVGTVFALLDARPAFLLGWLGYHFGFWCWKGTTIGGMVVGIKILRADGRLVDYAVALVRCLAAIFSAAALMLGFFWAGWDREKRAWHDMIAGTIVVRLPR